VPVLSATAPYETRTAGCHDHIFSIPGIEFILFVGKLIEEFGSRRKEGYQLAWLDELNDPFPVAWKTIKISKV
jgi:hypothetical protein